MHQQPLSRLSHECPDCQSNAPDVTRRSFLQATAGTAAALASAAWLGPRVYAAPTAESAAESAVGRFFASLSASQQDVICFPFDHELRKRISANWHVTKPVIGDDFYTDEQRRMINEIVRNVTSEDGYGRFIKQMEDDDGGLNFYSVAVFGKPGEGSFEWELTGRHLTLRADGNSVDRAAFGGPIVYGHGEEGDPSQNLFHYQTTAANEVFKALDAPQRKQALIAKAPEESAVPVQGADGTFPGIAVSELSKDQRALVRDTLKMLLAPYRQEDVAEVMEIVQQSGGVKNLRMAFYQQGDLQSDGEWDIWRIEGPSLVWHFRGAPHVHAYINISATT
jgi:hypothetical protein